MGGAYCHWRRNQWVQIDSSQPGVKGQQRETKISESFKKQEENGAGTEGAECKQGGRGFGKVGGAYGRGKDE